MTFDRWPTADDIAAALSITPRGARKRAALEKWPFKKTTLRGGKQYRYRLADLPEDVQIAYAASLQTSLEDLREQLKPASKTEKKIAIPRYCGRATKTKDVKPLEETPEARLQIAALRMQVIKAWSASGLTVQDFVKAYNAGVAVPDLREKLGPHGDISTFQSFYRWLASYEKHGLAGLAPQYAVRRGGNGATLSEDEKEYIRALYLDESRPSCRTVERDLPQFIGHDVSYWIIYRYLKEEIPASVKAFYREGEKKYHDRFDPYISRDYSLFRSMEWGVSDHHMFDFMVEHEGRIFRPWLTAFIDMRSRLVTGWHIDVIPSSLTILRALDPTLRDYGPFENLLIDNGKDFKCMWLAGTTWKERRTKPDEDFLSLAEGVYHDCGFNLHFTQPYRGQSKPIERFFGTVIELFSKRMETYVGSNTATRPDEAKLYWGRIDGRDKVPVTLTLEDVRREFASFVAWYNAQWQHSGDGMDGKSPLRVFQENLTVRRVMPEPFRLYVMTRREKRTIQRNGVTIDGVEYFTPEMIQHAGDQVEVRRGLDDVGKVSVWKLPERTFLYYAYNDILRDMGVPEENVRRRKQAEKEQRKLVKQDSEIRETIRKIRKRPDQLLADEAIAAAPAYPEGQIIQVVNGDVVLPDEKGRASGGHILQLQREKPSKRQLKGIFDDE